MAKPDASDRAPGYARGPGMSGHHASQALSASRVLAMVAFVVFQMAAAGDAQNSRALYAVGAALFLVTSCAIVGWVPVSGTWRVRLLWLEVVVATSLCVYAARTGDGQFLQTLFLPIVITAGTERHPGTIAGAGVGWLVAVLSVRAGWGGLSPIVTVLGNGTLLLFGWSAGALIRAQAEARNRADTLLARVRESEKALDRAHRQLKESAERQLELAALDERQRIAREIHDGVAHHLTSLLVQLQTARRLTELAVAGAAAGAGAGTGADAPLGASASADSGCGTAPSPQPAPPELANDQPSHSLLPTLARMAQQCEGLARDALLETRLAVRALRNPALLGATEEAALRRLAADFQQATGVQVVVTASSAMESLTPVPERVEALYRVAQEALTNAYRHAGATQVRMALHLTGGARPLVELKIENDGVPPVTLRPGGGMTSMRERAEALQGTVTFTALAAGMLLTLALPAPGAGQRAGLVAQN